MIIIPPIKQIIELRKLPHESNLKYKMFKATPNPINK